MKTLDNAAAAAFFEGSCAKQHEYTFEIISKNCRQENVIQLFPCDEVESETYSEEAERHDRLAGRCLVFAFIASFLGVLLINRFLLLSTILLVPSLFALVYGLWYELFGRQ